MHGLAGEGVGALAERNARATGHADDPPAGSFSSFGFERRNKLFAWRKHHNHKGARSVGNVGRNAFVATGSRSVRSQKRRFEYDGGIEVYRPGLGRERGGVDHAPGDLASNVGPGTCEQAARSSFRC